MKLRQPNKISLIRSNVIHKSESEQTIKNGVLSASNAKNVENHINKPLKDDVANFNAPLSRRQSDKALINMNANTNAYNNNVPLLNQTLKTPSNSNKNLIEIPENNNVYNNHQYQTQNNNMIDLNHNSKNMPLQPDNNYERKYSNNKIPNLNNFNNNINYEKRNSYSNNNMINLNQINQRQQIQLNNKQIPLAQNERVFRSNNNITQVRKTMSLLPVGSALSKSDNNTNYMKSRSNPLLQYVTIGIKSNDEFKRINSNLDGNISNRGSRRRPTNTVSNTNNNVNAFSVYTSSAAENSKKIFDKGVLIVKENYKTILALFLLLGGGAYVYKLYREDPNLFSEMYGIMKRLLPNDVSQTLAKYFNPEFIKDNIFTLCVLVAVLIAFIFIILKYREHTRYNRIAEEDYTLIKQILEASRHKEDNCDLIGLFESNFVKDNSEKHNLSEEIYRTRILPLMQEARMNDDLIEEGEILIQDQAHKVWRLRKDNDNNPHDLVYNDV